MEIDKRFSKAAAVMAKLTKSVLDKTVDLAHQIIRITGMCP